MTYKYTTRRPKPMNTNNEVKTRLVFETENNRYIWESPYADVTMDDILDAFYGMLISATWQPETVIKCMRDFAEDHAYIFEKEDEQPTPHFYA